MKITNQRLMIETSIALLTVFANVKNIVAPKVEAALNTHQGSDKIPE